jgi:hypothetical protein
MTSVQYLLFLVLLVSSCAQAAAATLVISGEQRIQMSLQGKTSTVSQTSFEFRTQGFTNWALLNRFPSAGSSATASLVDDSPYLLVANLTNDLIGGFVPASQKDLFESLTEDSRAVLTAFIPRWTGPGSNEFPVPFLFPRNPALFGYDWVISRSTNSPYLPEKITFRFNEHLIDVTDATVGNFFRESPFSRSNYKSFVQSQKIPGVYVVSRWTNFQGLTIPMIASVTHNFWEDGKAFPQIQNLTVTNLSFEIDSDLRPLLTTNGTISQVVEGGVYQYPTTEKRWLTIPEAKLKGRFLPRTMVSQNFRPVKLAWSFRLLIDLLLLASLILLAIWYYARCIARTE